MQQHLAARAPFELAQSIAFLRRFTPCQGDHRFAAGGFTTAALVDDRAVAVRIEAGPAGAVTLTHAPVGTAGAAAIAAHVRDLLGLDDDLTRFYAAADGDAAFAPIVAALHGLHHVRFAGLADIAVCAVLMQRRPIATAGAMRRRVLARFGRPVAIGADTLHAWPVIDALVGLDEAAWRAAGVDAAKAAQLPTVVRGVAALGERYLRDAPYGEASAALQRIPGVGPFSAGAILLRGLGRMDDVPLAMRGFAEPARALYGAGWDPRATVRRYGADLGYWSFYLKTGAPRLASSAVTGATPV